jgi:Leucine-rich repeat (LRR) protein
LFLAQNRIANIQPNLSSSIPNLRTLVLTKNRIAELADLDSLAGFKSLVYLSLMGNPVAAKEVCHTFLHSSVLEPNSGKHT